MCSSDLILRDAGSQGDDTSDVGGIGRWSDIPEDDLVDLVGAEAGPLQDGLRRQPPQLLGGDAGERAEGFHEGGPDPLDDGDVEHGCTRFLFTFRVPRPAFHARMAVRRRET